MICSPVSKARFISTLLHSCVRCTSLHTKAYTCHSFLEWTVEFSTSPVMQRDDETGTKYTSSHQIRKPLVACFCQKPKTKCFTKGNCNKHRNWNSQCKSRKKSRPKNGENRKTESKQLSLKVSQES